MEVSSDNENDECGNYQTEVDIRTQPRRMGTQQKLNVPHRRNH